MVGEWYSHAVITFQLVFKPLPLVLGQGEGRAADCWVSCCYTLSVVQQYRENEGKKAKIMWFEVLDVR